MLNDEFRNRLCRGTRFPVLRVTASLQVARVRCSNCAKIRGGILAHFMRKRALSSRKGACVNLSPCVPFREICMSAMTERLDSQPLAPCSTPPKNLSPSQKLVLFREIRTFGRETCPLRGKTHIPADSVQLPAKRRTPRLPIHPRPALTLQPAPPLGKTGTTRTPLLQKSTRAKPRGRVAVGLLSSAAVVRCSADYARRRQVRRQ